MIAVTNRPQTNLPCQHGISIAQRGWMYENMGYAASAMTMYQQAVRTLSRGIDQMGESAPDDALFHLGASQLRLGCMNRKLGNLEAARQLVEKAVPNLEAAWERLPDNRGYQQALAQASMMLDENERVGDEWSGHLATDLFGAVPV